MEQFNINKGVTIKPGLDVLPPPVTDDEYRALMAGEDRYLMTESNTLEEIEATFFYDTPIHWCATDLLEAISSTRLQLHRTMQAFVRALNQKLNGTGISAGSDKTGDVAQNGARAIGGAEIGRARNVNGLPVLPAIIPLSDGQTISILFHSPTAENRITNSDTLVAFQFLLNKKDVTHTVAPMSGRDMTLAQVTMKLANLAEKNSAKFQRAQKKKKALVDEITQLQADSDQKEDAMSDLADQVAAVEGQKADLEQKINAVASEADSLYEENERLQTEIDQLNRTGGRETIAPAGMTGGHSRAMTDRLASIKNRMHMNGEVTLSNGASMKQFIEDGEGYIQLTDSDGSVYMIKAKSIQGVDMVDAIGKLFKAYKAGNVSEYLVQPEEHKPENVEPEPAEDTGSSSPEPEVSVGAYRYALQMRPAAPGAIPEGNKAILPRPDEGDPYYEYARYGIATYNTPLSDQQMSEYDLKLLPREDSFDFLAKTLTNGPFGKYAQKALELATSSPDEFRVMLKTQFSKNFPQYCVSGWRWHRENGAEHDQCIAGRSR
ncbi:Phage protein (plasmid) [Escherichia coli]|nr:Phage protein [Escherichia coli]